MPLTLVILAAGVGRRFGGLKQLEHVGPSGETIMDYSVFDALRADFGRVVFVIRPEMDATFHATLGQRYATRIPVAYVHQRLDAVPPGFSVPPDRTKPWGTSQAVLAVADVVGGPFAVINADDFYGAGSFATLADFLRQPQREPVPTYALVGYELRNTLSEAGTVSRGVCRCTPDGWLVDIVETHGIERHATGPRYPGPDGTARMLTGDEVVSMNMWGFVPPFFEELRAGFSRFLQAHAGSHDAEFYLPIAIQDALRAGRARVKVLPSPDTWCGITNPRDVERVTAHLRQLVAHGQYPTPLWG